jgi:hypothetical protein
VRHDGDDGRQAAVADRQPYGVGAGRGQAAAGVLQHRRGDVDAERSPAQAAYAADVNAGAAADLQAGASSRPSRLPSAASMPSGSVPGVAVAARNSCSYQSAISS